MRNIPKELKIPKMIEEKSWTEKVDVRDVDIEDLKLIEEAGKKRGNKRKGGEKNDKSKSNEANNDQKRKEEEEKEQREWEEAWNKKLRAEEALVDKTFCKAHGFYPKPKTQSNIWIQVTQAKGFQDVQLCFQ